MSNPITITLPKIVGLGFSVEVPPGSGPIKIVAPHGFQSEDLPPALLANRAVEPLNPGTRIAFRWRANRDTEDRWSTGVVYNSDWGQDYIELDEPSPDGGTPYLRAMKSWILEYWTLSPESGIKPTES